MSRPYAGARDNRAHVITDLDPDKPYVLGRDEHRRVTVVGGGLAGVAAAVVLAERGVTVTLHEASEVLGGRVSSWPDTLSSGESFSMERGFHAFFRQYYK